MRVCAVWRILKYESSNFVQYGYRKSFGTVARNGENAALRV